MICRRADETWGPPKSESMGTYSARLPKDEASVGILNCRYPEDREPSAKASAKRLLQLASTSAVLPAIRINLGKLLALYIVHVIQIVFDAELLKENDDLPWIWSLNDSQTVRIL